MVEGVGDFSEDSVTFYRTTHAGEIEVCSDIYSGQDRHLPLSAELGFSKESKYCKEYTFAYEIAKLKLGDE